MKIETISINPNVLALCSPALLKKIKQLLRDKTELHNFAKFNAPFVNFPEGGQPELISHHYIYLLLKHAGEKTLQVRRVTTEQEVNSILSADKISTTLLEKAMLYKSGYSAKAQTHQKRRIAGQICPLCGGPLERKRTAGEALRDGQEHFIVHCHYRRSRDIKCNFATELNREEYELFRRNEYPTKLWLVKLDMRCPKCRDVLYERRMLDGQRYHQCKKTLMEGYDSYGGFELCDFRKEIINE